MVLCNQSFVGLALCVSAALAGVLAPRAGTTSTTSIASEALIATTVSGQLTTVPVDAPTTSASLATSTSSSSTSSMESPVPSTGSTTASAPNALPTNPLLCENAVAGPFCLPSNESTLYVNGQYWVTWDASLFAANSTIVIALNYYNNTSTMAWTSDTLPVQQSFVAVQMQSSWLQGYKSINLTFEAISYTAKSPQGAATPLTGPTIVLTTSHLPAPPPTQLPSKESLMIALPIALGCCAFIVLGLFFGMRKHRILGVGSVYGRRGRGYGERKSRRQRLAVQKGAIRLEEREVPQEPRYADADADADEITPAPRTTEQRWQPPANHRREESLGSLVDGDESNAFRRELRAQQRAGR